MPEAVKQVDTKQTPPLDRIRIAQLERQLQQVTTVTAALERENLALRSSLNKVLGQLGMEPIAATPAAQADIATAGEPKPSNSSKNSGANNKNTAHSGRRRLSMKAVAHAARASARLQKAGHEASQAKASL